MGTFHQSTVDHWKKDIVSRSARTDPVAHQVITQAELAVIPLALRVWGSRFEHRNVLMFVDNNAAKDALVHGISTSHAMSEVIRDTRLTCTSLSLGVWYDRVPSPANLADAPSRGETAELDKIGAKAVAVVDLPHLMIHTIELS